MTNNEFKFWINGYLALSSEKYLNEKQFIIIQNHSNLVKTVEESLDDGIVLFLKALKKEQESSKHLCLTKVKIMASTMLKQN